MEDRPWINIDLSSYKAAFEAKIREKNSQKMFNTYVQTHSLKFGEVRHIRIHLRDIKVLRAWDRLHAGDFKYLSLLLSVIGMSDCCVIKSFALRRKWQSIFQESCWFLCIIKCTYWIFWQINMSFDQWYGDNLLLVFCKGWQCIWKILRRLVLCFVIQMHTN